MDLRVTPSIISHNANRNVQLRNTELARLQQQISSGLRISRPADDPFGFSEIGAYRQQLRALQAESSNIDQTQSQLSLSVTQLQDVSNIFVQAKQLALQGVQSVDQNERNALAIEVDHLISRLLSSANASYGGEYVFSGANTRQKPFEQIESPIPDELPQVRYTGSKIGVETLVSASISVTSRTVGSEIFSRRGRGETRLLPNKTGLQLGGGKDNATGRATIQLSHTATSFTGASGIATGTNSIAGDTVLGTHSLEIIDLAGDGSSGTISLNGGAAVSFTSADDNLRVVGPQGEIVFLDTTNITAGFSGNVSVQADGVISIDGGATSIPIDFSADQILTHSVRQSVTHVDTSGVKQTGRVNVEYQDTADAFTTLFELRDDLLNNRKLANDGVAGALGRRLADIDSVSDQIFGAIGQQSADLEDLSILKQRNEDVQFELNVVLANREAVDYADVTTRLQESLNLLQFTYAASSQILNQSILDYF
jgi:flagellar hook-associated protein 3